MSARNTGWQDQGRGTGQFNAGGSAFHVATHLDLENVLNCRPEYYVGSLGG
jgi:hypothetical protein